MHRTRRIVLPRGPKHLQQAVEPEIRDITRNTKFVVTRVDIVGRAPRSVRVRGNADDHTVGSYDG